MVINIVYIFVFLICSFLLYLIVKSILRGVSEKNRNYKK